MSVTACNIGGWETNFAADKDSVMGGYLNNDLSHIIIRIGENILPTQYDDMTAAFDNLLQYLKLRTDAQISVSGTFYPNSDKEKFLQTFADLNGLLYIPLSDLSIQENREEMGNFVYGDDAQWHQINHSGVANHPNDKGHAAIAERLYKSLFTKTSNNIVTVVKDSHRRSNVYGLNGMFDFGSIYILDGKKVINHCR